MNLQKKHKYPQATKSQPHITLAQFVLDESKEEWIVNTISEACVHQPFLKVEMKDYNYFPHHTLFVDLVNQGDIIGL